MCLDTFFQEDNDAKHTFHYVVSFFKRNNIDVICWPSQSRDLNPVEHLCDFINKEVKKIHKKYSRFE